MRPFKLPPNGVPRFYRGGPAISALRGIQLPGDRVPEEWVGSTTTVFGEEELGLSRLADGTLLRDAIAAAPDAYLGPDHVARYGADPALLVKLLDAGERLPVHLHPDGDFGRAVLGLPYGKTEAWVVVGTVGESGTVWLGFRSDADVGSLDTWVAEQDHEALLGALNEVPVGVGDALFVPAGVPHAIGEGLLIVELQEPTDLSILLEWEGFGVDDEARATLGLGWERAMQAVERRPRPVGPLLGAGVGEPSAADSRPAGGGRDRVESLLPPGAEAFFRAERVGAGGYSRLVDLEAGFAVVVVLDGSGSLSASSGAPLDVSRGDVMLVPYAAGAWRLGGDAVALVCRPPVVA